jgi:ribosomal 30S subunit maturation factor RimM
MADDWLHIGRVTAVNAARRQLRLSVTVGREDVLKQCDRLRLVHEGDAPMQVCIKQVKVSGAEVTVELTPGISRDMVAVLRNALVMAPAQAGYRPDGRMPGLHELPGMRVVTASGEVVGDVLETQDTPGGGIMRLRCDNAVMAMAPVTDAFIEKIDLDAGVITVNTPEAFLVMDADDSPRKPPRRAAQDDV